MTVDGLPVLTPARAWISLAGPGASVEDLVVVADSMLRKYGDSTLADLDLQLDRWTGRRFVDRLRRARALSRPGVDSAPESILRTRFVLGGLPEPSINHDVVDARGAWLHRPDLSWPRYRVGFDYDGAPHLTGSESRHARDMARFEILASEGWLLRVVTARDLRAESRHIVHAARALLIERGAPLE
jgi:hypothetical protein